MLSDTIRPNCKVYGPYKRKDGRQHVVVYNFSENIRKTISYPKWLMEQKLGRELDPNLETIDHLDRDFNNNSEENIEIKERSKHIKDDAIRAQSFHLTCIWCLKDFIVKGSAVGDRIHSKNKGHAGPFCSRQCSGRYGASIQNNQSEILEYSNLPDRKYYTNKNTALSTTS